MRLSVVILTCRQRDLTLRCLHSIYALSARPDCEIILVDNGSDDDTTHIVGVQFPRVKCITLSHNHGVAGGRNIGLRAAGGDRLMILDNDTVASPEAILALAAYLDAHPECGLVAPRLVDARGRTQASFKPFPGLLLKMRNWFSKDRENDYLHSWPEKEIEPFYVIGAAQMFDGALYQAVGGLDEKIFFGPEDADFCMSVRRMGRRVVYLPSVTIIHDWQRSTSGRRMTRRAWRHFMGLLHFYCKHRRFI